MKTKLLFLSIGLFFTSLFTAQNVTVFQSVPFYSMYHYLGEGETLPPEAYSQIPEGAIRLHAYERDIISRKLSDAEIASLGSNLTMNITLIAACDNYDRIAGVNLALVPKGSTTYTWEQTDVKRIEIGRFITPFMNKNNSPTEVPYSYKIDNISTIIHNPTLLATYDMWIEFRADGYSAAANTQVAGCGGRTDVFRGNLELVSTGTPPTSPNFFLPLSYRQNLNNYNATDIPGQTTRIINFTLAEPVPNAVLHLISSNHGANSNGEEYNRREHYVYLDDQLIHHYKPGGKSCEDYRQYNTQGNGIYGTTPKTLRNWLSWSNWCPGDAIPNREINLGNLSAGNHTIKLDVPTAVFPNGEGYFPISMYIQNQNSGQVICATPKDIQVTSQQGTTVNVGWTESGDASQWEVLWGRKSSYSTSFDVYQQIDTEPVTSRNDLIVGFFYEMYVRAKCTDDQSSLWNGAAFSNIITLATNDSEISKTSIFPNPIKDVLNIKTDKNIKSIEIYSVTGQKVLVTDQIQNNQVNLSKLTPGNYMVKVIFNQNDLEKTFKIIKK